jgi:hypothetical protein
MGPALKLEPAVAYGHIPPRRPAPVGGLLKEFSFMRRFALLGLILLLPGCSGFTDFLGDTHTFTRAPNQPLGNSENLRRVRGLDPDPPPLQPESGNVWPGPVAAPPTLGDIERMQSQPGAPQPGTIPDQGPGPALPSHRQPRPAPRGSSTPPSSNPPGLEPDMQISPAPPPSLPSPAAPTPNTYLTPQGQVTGTTPPQGGRFDTLGGSHGAIVVPNGNGTSTIIGPNGSIQTVPTPK